MGCCGSKGGVADAEAREARRERERERPRANGADDEDEDDAVSSSRARVQAWQMEADEAEEEDDAHPEPDGLVGGLDEERAGKWVSKSARSAMARAFKEALHSGKYRFERDKENALSARRLGENHPQCRGNPLAGRILASFSEKRDGGLRKKDWIAACAVLHPDGSYPNKARAGFDAYDFDGDGVVNEKDLIATLRLILGRRRQREAGDPHRRPVKKSLTRTTTACWRRRSSGSALEGGHRAEVHHGPLREVHVAGMVTDVV